MAKDNPYDDDYVPQNIYAEPIHVKLRELERYSKNSQYKHICPVCKVGILPVCWDINTLKLLPEDRCLLCGQMVIYDDLHEVFDH